MGKLVTVKSGYSAVLLPDKAGSGSQRNYSPGDTVTVTDAEYAAFNAATLQAITLTTSGLPDPYRKGSDPGATTDSPNATVSGAATAVVGWNDWVLTGNVASVTVSANNPATSTVGPTSGAASQVSFKLTQDGTGSRLVTWGSKFKFVGGTAPTLSTGAGKTDIVRFVTFDGGATFLETDRNLDIR